MRDYDILTLAPHQRSPIINFGHVKADQKCEKVLVIKNPQHFQIKVNVTYRGATMNEDNTNKLTLVIEEDSQIDFKIKYAPVEPGTHKYVISFDSKESFRKINVSCYGECLPSTTFKKPVSVRRTLGQLKTNINKPTNTLLFEVNPIHTCKYEATNKATSLPIEQNNYEAYNLKDAPPIKRKYIVESIFMRPTKRNFPLLFMLYGDRVANQPSKYSI